MVLKKGAVIDERVLSIMALFGSISYNYVLKGNM